MGAGRASIRILVLLVIAIGLVGLSPLALATLAAAMAVTVLLYFRDVVPELRGRIFRLRWFFLAIFILYLFGAPDLRNVLAWQEAAYRCGVLVILVSAVTLCLHGLPAHEVAASVAKALAPTRHLGVPVDAFARRLAETLDAVAHMDERVRRAARLDRHAGIRAIADICLEAENVSVNATSLKRPAWQPAQRTDWVLLVTSLVLIALLQVLL